MSRLIRVALAIAISAASTTFAADPNNGGGGAREARARTRPFWGTVVKASDQSLTVTPERRASRRGEPPAEPEDRTVALARDVTEFAHAEVGMERMMFDGTMLRTLNEPERASAADLRPGQLVQVTPGDDPAAPAKRVMITWSVAGTVVKIDAESITLRPAPKRQPPGRDDDAAPAQPPAKPPPEPSGQPTPPAEDQTFELSDSTRVRIASVTGRQSVPGGDGRRVQTTIAYRDGQLADLEPGQSVILCVKDEAATKITIHQAEAEQAGQPR